MVQTKNIDNSLIVSEQNPTCDKSSAVADCVYIKVIHFCGACEGRC